jgi:DNA-binding NarL/FixJ family response regulator
MPLRILVADDHLVVRAGLKAGLAEHDMLVVAEADCCEQLLALAPQTPCDAALVDVRLPDSDGLYALSQLRTMLPALPVVMMTGFNNPNFLSKAIELGASAFLTKDLPLSRFAELLRMATDGQSCFTREDLRRVTGALATPRLGPEYEVPLTHRECEVLRLMGDGLSNKQIAERMHISYETVKEHVQHILQKVGVVDRTQAVYWALRTGVITPSAEIDGHRPTS